VVFTNGCYDILHVGHLRLLESARALGDALVVGVNRDESVGRLKGMRRPFVPFEEISDAKVVKVSPIRVELTLRDGRQLRIFETWTGERLSKDSDDVLHDVVKRFTASSAGR